MSMPTTKYAIAIVALTLASPVIAQTTGTTPATNPALQEDKNTPGRSAGAPANLSNDVKTGSTSPSGNTATGGPVGRGQGGSN